MRDGRFGRLTVESTARDVLAVLDAPEDTLRTGGKGEWSVIWKYGGLQVAFHQRWVHGLFFDSLQFLLIEFEGESPPEALGLDLEHLGARTTLAGFEALAGRHEVALRDVTPAALRGPYVVVAGPADVYASFHETRLHAFGAPLSPGRADRS